MNFNNLGTENEWFDKTITLAEPLVLARVTKMYFYFKVNNQTHDAGLAVGSMQKYTVKAGANDQWVKVVIEKEELASYFGDVTQLESIRFIRQVGVWSWESITISSISSNVSLLLYAGKYIFFSMSIILFILLSDSTLKN